MNLHNSYPSILNHSFNLIHFFIAFILIYVLYPKLIFRRSNKNPLDNVVGGFLRIIPIIIAVGYLLVLLKLFEVLGLIIFLILILFYRISSRKSMQLLKERVNGFNAYIYDVTDKKESVKRNYEEIVSNIKDNLSSRFHSLIENRVVLVHWILIILIILYSSWLRFYDGFHYAPPAMSDGSVTLAWMKYIIGRKLFVDGIYPQGFHIYLAILQKIAFINPLYILKYAGPLNGVFITFSIYFFLTRILKNNASGLIGAVIYGILGGSLLTLQWMRQAASNSQEFGYVFVLPTLYYFYRYLETQKKENLIIGFSGASAAGLVHAVGFAFTALGTALLVFAALIVDAKRNWKFVLNICIAGILSAIVAVIPIGIGFAMGKGFNTSSAEFLTLKVETISVPVLNKFDYIALTSIAVIGLFLIFHLRQIKRYFHIVFIFVLCIFAFLIYYYGGVLTQSSVVSTRFSDLWALSSPIAIGTVIYCFLYTLKNIKYREVIGLGICTIMLLTSVFYFNPQPIITYKMERNAEVEQILRISSSYLPTEWTIVCDTDGAYSEILGTGSHIRTNDFLKEYKPESKFLLYGSSEYKIPDIFIYYDKKDFILNFDTRKQDNIRRKTSNTALKKWLKVYRDNHDNLQVFYEDNDFVIYHIHQEESRSDTFNTIWNN